MKSKGGSWRQHLRVTWAIARKDILDGWKNKTILGNIIIVTLMILFYKSLPSWENSPAVPNLRVYDAGKSRLVVALGDSTTVKLHQYESQQEMERILAKGDIPEIGLVIPADFDQALEAGEQLELDGYVVHWVSDKDAEELRQMAGAELTALVGKSVYIKLAGNKVYTQADSTGLAFLASISVIFSVAMLGLLVTPGLMIEEKHAKTIDALLVSPASSSHVITAKALAGLFYCLFAAGIALAVNAAIVTQWWLAILATIGGALFMVAIGLLLGSLVEVRQQLGIWVFGLNFILLIPAFLSIMQDLIPQEVRNVFHWIPTVALSKVLRISFSNQSSLASVGPELALIFGVTFVLLTALAWSLRRSDR
jgi:ABC-type transport system involved in multi-copper enzyme maturation permease subunit